MCDKSKEIMPGWEDFHPAYHHDSIKPYLLDDLTKAQQEQLNDVKIDTIRENNKYLNCHPEVRAIIALIFRTLFKERPKKTNLYEIIAKKLFLQPAIGLRKEIDEYINERGSLVKQCEIYVRGPKSFPDGVTKKSKRKTGKATRKVSFDGRIVNEEELGTVWPSVSDYSTIQDTEEYALVQVHQYVQKQKEREKEEEAVEAAEEEENEEDDESKEDDESEDTRSIQFHIDDDDDIQDAQDLSMISVIGERSTNGSGSLISGGSSSHSDV